MIETGIGKTSQGREFYPKRTKKYIPFGHVGVKVGLFHAYQLGDQMLIDSRVKALGAFIPWPLASAKTTVS